MSVLEGAVAIVGAVVGVGFPMLSLLIVATVKITRLETHVNQLRVDVQTLKEHHDGSRQSVVFP